MTSAKPDIGELVAAVERLTKLFKLERCVYLCATIISLIMLLSSAVVLLSRREGAGPSVLVLLFGSSGVIGYSTARLLRMWDTAMRFLMGAKAGGEGETP